jgi:putative ABC transport system permease protein
MGIPPDFCSYFLIQAEPGADITALTERIRQRVPDLEVYDKATYSRICMNYWLTRTGIGISFGLATLLGLLVGLVMVAQTLYASVSERLKEFATLQAMGAGPGALSGFLVTQALGNAVVGSIFGLVGALVMGHYLDSPRAPVLFAGWVMAGSVVLTTGICLVASWLAYWQLHWLDLAGVLRS